MTLKTLILVIVLLCVVAGEGGASAGTTHTFGWQGDHLLLDGKPFTLRCGEMHYPRVPRAYWRDRMRKARAMGLNAICTYVFWNLHEPSPGKFDFSGNLDVAAFIRTAQREGLWVVLRPGPYICTEWDWGGFPPWLFATPDIHVRSTDPRFLAAAGRYLKRLGKELAPLQVTHGGPILMAQVENEYGSFGHDHVYMDAIRQRIREAGFDVQLYTADGPSAEMLNGGTLPEPLAACNFGGEDPKSAFEEFDRFRPNMPKICGEYWIGWFDHWGEFHHTTDASGPARGVDWMMSHGVSFNLYMFHGGTSFGFMSGANWGNGYEPDVSSYDYDSPLDEAGRPTAKFTALRDVIRKLLPAGETLPNLPPSKPTITIPKFALSESASLDDLLGAPVRSDRPKTMEALGQSYGFTLYRHRMDSAVTGVLDVREPRDFAVVENGGRVQGTLDRRRHQTTLGVELKPGALDILVENMGRVNFGSHILDDRKGITKRVSLAGAELTGWDCYPLPMSDLSRLKFTSSAKSGPAFHRGTCTLDNVGDTFLDMSGWGMGVVWVNGHNLGRYWRIGPQQTLFLPAPWLKRGKNEVVVLDLFDGADRSLTGVADPIYQTHASLESSREESTFASMDR